MSTLDGTYGALLIGVVAASILFGVTVLQGFIYFQKYANDRPWCKIAVCWLCALDALQLVFGLHLVYYYLITNYDRPTELSRIVWSFKARILVDVLVIISVHMLYTVRVWNLARIETCLAPFNREDHQVHDEEFAGAFSVRYPASRSIPWIVTVLVAVGSVYGIALASKLFLLHVFTDLLECNWATYGALGAATGIDVAIAAALCYFLSRCRSDLNNMNGILNKLIVYTVNTGLLTSVCSLAAIAMLAAYPHTFIVVGVEFLIAKLYINSYMAMLNARKSLRRYSRPAPPLLVTASTEDPQSPISPCDSKHVSLFASTNASAITAFDAPSVQEADIGVSNSSNFYKHPDNSSRMLVGQRIFEPGLESLAGETRMSACAPPTPTARPRASSVPRKPSSLRLTLSPLDDIASSMSEASACPTIVAPRSPKALLEDPAIVHAGERYTRLVSAPGKAHGIGTIGPRGSQVTLVDPIPPGDAPEQPNAESETRQVYARGVRTTVW